jgi:hypothetical protein
MASETTPEFPAPRDRVCFLFIAQPHQVLHSLPIALALARDWPQVAVEIAATSSTQLSYIAELTARLGARPLPARLLGPKWLRSLRPRGESIPLKAAMLIANALHLSGYDAIVAPERTTALLRRLGVRKPLLVYTQHGAGDREGPFEPRLRLFDLVMASGPKQRDRIVGEGLSKPEDCVIVGYPKFDIVEALPPSRTEVFETARPTVLYNPHFDASLSSWPREGMKILQRFADDGRYNLIFAPHVRLFDGEHPDRERLEIFRSAPNIHIDLGSPAMIDMTYARLSDVYLGDVSSQIYEFLRTPRPCVFINAHGKAWETDESYQAWRFGPVATSADDVIAAVDQSRADHQRLYLQVQQAAFADTFDLQSRPSSERAAEAIVLGLERGRR